MKNVIALLIFSSFLAQVTALTPFSSISSGYIQTINSTSFKILKSLFDESTKIAFRKQSIIEEVSLATESIEDEIDELKEFIADAVEDAKEDALDIGHCLNFTNIRNVNVAALFNRCKMPVQFKHIESQKKEIGKLSGAFPEEINLCILAATLLGNNLDDCLDKKIELVERKLIRISKSIEALMIAATDNSSACTQRVLRMLDFAVTKAVRQFEECADEVDLDSD